MINTIEDYNLFVNRSNVVDGYELPTLEFLNSHNIKIIHQRKKQWVLFDKHLKSNMFVENLSEIFSIEIIRSTSFFNFEDNHKICGETILN